MSSSIKIIKKQYVNGFYLLTFKFPDGDSIEFMTSETTYNSLPYGEYFLDGKNGQG